MLEGEVSSSRGAVMPGERRRYFQWVSCVYLKAMVKSGHALFNGCALESLKGKLDSNLFYYYFCSDLFSVVRL